MFTRNPLPVTVLVLGECLISIPTYFWGITTLIYSCIAMYWELTMLCFKVIVDGQTYRHTDSLNAIVLQSLRGSTNYRNSPPILPPQLFWCSLSNLTLTLTPPPHYFAFQNPRNIFHKIMCSNKITSPPPLPQNTHLNPRAIIIQQ